MENLIDNISEIKTLSVLKKEISNKIIKHAEDFDLLGEYKILTPFEVSNNNFTCAFEVEWCEYVDHSDGKTIYFYLTDINGDQVDGKYMWDLDVIQLTFFYDNILLKTDYKNWI